ncbi:MAG: hypothetical protein K6G81_01015 [Lachnospiraceae bacterium]|nr:hypothetical protein [Lachnospiraceae bacterium]
MDFGVRAEGAGFKAVCYAPEAKRCSIDLYRSGDRKPADKIEMLPVQGCTGIFECSFSLSGSSGICEYLFETDKDSFIDPYSRELTGIRGYWADTDEYRTAAASGANSVQAAGRDLEEALTALKDNGIDDRAGEGSDLEKKGSGRAKKGDGEDPGVRPHIRSRLSREELRPDFGFKCPDYEDLFIYKLHVRGFTVDKSSGAKHPGTYSGLVEKIPYMRQLGVNAVLLMPCYEFNERMIQGAGSPAKLNFWGYGAEGYYFAPKSGYASDPSNARREFFDMVNALHESGIAVFMEMDFASGTPDSLMLDALRMWRSEYGIDGFRIIGDYVFKRLFMSDPLLKGVKLIMNGHDMCESGDKACMKRIAECNDGFMVTVRRFLKGDEDQVKLFSEMFRKGFVKTGRVNYLADHDGFTLADVYSYDERHNRDNGENNLDGREINYSWNCGVEGETKSRQVLKLRYRMIKNALTVLFLSQGTPMLMAGDEFGLTHFGNNNPYCLDNEQSRVIWDKGSRAKNLHDFVRKLARLKTSHRVFANRAQLQGLDYIYSGRPDISFHGTRAWYPDFGYFSRTLGVLLNGDYAMVDRKHKDSTFYVAFNMHWEEHEFDLPVEAKNEVETALTTDASNKLTDHRSCVIRPRSIAVFAIKKQVINHPESANK